MRRFETIHNLAIEFNVCDRTIRRDIEIISLSEPIYTQTGRYGGGVYLVDRFYNDRFCMNKEQIKLLHKLYSAAEEGVLDITTKEKATLQSIILFYSKPEIE